MNLGYDFKLVYKIVDGYREADAVLIGWKRDKFQIVEAQEI